LIVSASSLNCRPTTPDGLVTSGVPSRVTPMKPMRAPRNLLTVDDGKSVFVRPIGVTPDKIERIDVATGSRTLVTEIHPADRAGLVDLAWFFVSGDGRSYVYSYRRNLGALYVGTPER